MPAGLITGLTLDSNPDQIVTATLKAVGFQTADLLDAVAADGVTATELRVDGGMAVNDWFCQFLADVVGMAVVRPASIETTVLGAGLLAAVGAGLHGDIGVASRVWAAAPSAGGVTAQLFTPAVDAERRAQWLRGWRRAVERAL